MVTFVKGDLLDAKVDIICHQVNLQGVMGGGIALQIAQRYPSVEKEYMEYPDKVLGEVCFSLTSKNNYMVANCFSQNEDFTTNYNALKTCLEEVKKMMFACDFETIGFPFKYGCGIASGDWDKVLEIITDVFENNDVLIYIKD